ncbi:hypothetical protein B4N84_05140 [Flavobacterium sp. IR1]|nr:hypothetical protein B4N84_05140 [Flavobacterium sp. IR1]
MQKLYILLLLTFSSLVVGQTGMGTPTPRGALDINRPLTNTFGLVLPTNDDTAKMLNPQGGTIAEGTMMYDSTDKCIKFFDGTAWSDCLTVGSSNSYLTADCTKDGFVGTFERGTTLSGATFKITITNKGKRASKLLSFQTTDLVLSGVSGISVSGVSLPSAIIPVGQSITVTYNLSGTPTGGGTLTGDWSNIDLGCTNTVTVNSGNIRIAYWASYTIGSSHFSTFNAQLQNPVNYGSGGTYSNMKGFIFTNITNTLATLSATQLVNNYDIICTGFSNMSSIEAAKIKEYVDKGGIAFVLCDDNVGTALLNVFGGTGSVTAGDIDANVTTNSINNGAFGITENTKIAGEGSLGRINTNQLPSGAVILADYNSQAKVFLLGNDNRAIFFWDEGAFRNTIVRDAIDTTQEKFLHNVMAYALGKI